MKKILYSMLVLMAAFTFTSCEDVPAPYDIPSEDGGEEVLPEGEYLNETFSSDFGDFEVVTVKGTAWVIDYSTAKASGYDNSSQTTTESESYLVSPSVDLSGSEGAYLQFEYIYRYSGTDRENKVLITDNYTGDPTTTTWVDITGDLTEGSDWSTFSTYAKNLDSSYIGKSDVRIALYYSCGSNSATWEVKNLVMKEGEVSETETPDEPSTDGKGTVESPYTVAEALAIINAGTYTTSDVYVSGTISQIDDVSTSYGNATYYISDDGTTTSQLEVYRGYYLGGEKFTSADQIKVGDKVVVCGTLTMYYSTPEITTGSSIYSINGSTSGDDGGDDSEEETVDGYATVTKSGTTITMVNPNATESSSTATCTLNTYGWENASDPQLVTLDDGTTISFAQEGGNNSPKYYTATNGVRMYALNSMTIAGSKSIAKVVVTCDSYDGTDYVGNDALYTSISGNTWKMVNDHTSNSGGVQVRVKVVEITYAE
ncbi:MAG: hypothetical protein Q4D41_08125 [Prevotellaceae bacterium]|nr:hypothetical protein [Prevotellaceae bacterium]